LAALKAIESSRTPLANPLSLVRWNLSKDYLRELGTRGVRVVPTIWSRGLRLRELEEAFNTFACDEIVIKPSIGASAGDTYRLTHASAREKAAELESVFSDRDFMTQPFLQAVVEEGEFSLFYFGGRFSHAVLKSPKPRDFRVQEEHGAAIHSVAAPRESLHTAERILQQLEISPLYARVDLVRDGDRDFFLMELELIEPALYFRTDEQAADRFATAFEQWISENSG
jgi:hypothetical protein